MHTKTCGPATTVLVVEDEVLIRMAIAEQLRDRNYVVFEASNADEALSILQSGTPVQVVLTDVNMPGILNGIELSRLVHATWPTITVAVTSAHGWSDEIDSNVGFFPKPCSIENLVAHIESTAQRRNVPPASTVAIG